MNQQTYSHGIINERLDMVVGHMIQKRTHGYPDFSRRSRHAAIDVKMSDAPSKKQSMKIVLQVSHLFRYADLLFQHPAVCHIVS